MRANRSATYTAMLAQREAVLSAATDKVAARATDPELNELLHMAASATAPTNPTLLAGGRQCGEVQLHGSPVGPPSPHRARRHRIPMHPGAAEPLFLGRGLCK